MNQLATLQGGDFLPAEFFGAQSLNLPPDLTIEEWGRVLERVTEIAGASPWWVGDALAYGSEAWPAEWAQYLDDRYSPDQLSMYFRISREYPPDTRIKGLSWTCHREAAKVAPMGKLRRDLMQQWSEQKVPEEMKDKGKGHRGLINYMRSRIVNSKPEPDKPTPAAPGRVHVERNGEEYEVVTESGQALATFYTDKAATWAKAFADTLNA